MRIDPNKLGHTVTVVNTLSARDGVLPTDTLYATVLYDAIWSVVAERSVTGTTTAIGSVYKVQLPHLEHYKEYTDWIADREGNWTMRTGDRIILGDVSAEVNSSPIATVMDKHKPNACTVRLVRDTSSDSVGASDKGLLMYADVLYIEGV